MMAEQKCRQAGKVLFYLVLLIEIGIVLVDKSAYINPIEGRLFQITFVLCMIKIAMTKYSLKEWAVMAVFFVLGALSYFATGRNEIIRIVAFLAASKDIELRSTLKVTFYVTLAGVLALMAMSLLGIMGTVYLDANYRNHGIERRYCLGLGHPNALHCMVWALITLGIYLYFKKLKWYHYLLLEALNVGFFLFTDSRTGVIAATCSITLGATFSLFPGLQKARWIYILGAIGVALCLLFSVAAAIFGCEIPLFEWLNGPLTGRIYGSHLYNGITFWSLFSSPENTMYMDMGFIRLFYWYGVVPGIVYFAVKGYQLSYAYKKRDAAAFLVITMFALYTVFEAHAVSVYLARDYALLLMVGTWSEMFGLTSEKEGYFWQPGKLLKR